MFDSNAKYAYGPIPFLMHQGLWKSAPEDPDVTKEEYEQVCSDLHEKLCQYMQQKGESLEQPPCYVVGIVGDRTQQLQFPDYSFLTPELVRYLQELLRTRWNKWRISIAAGYPDELILIYPTVVCIDRVMKDEELDAAVRHISKVSVERDEEAERIRQARIDRVRPLLVDAYKDALEEGKFAYLVSVEDDGNNEEGIVRIWVAHPKDKIVFDLDEYETIPRAGYREYFHLTPLGVLHRIYEAQLGPNIMLALWEFNGDEERTFMIQRGFETIEFTY